MRKSIIIYLAGVVFLSGCKDTPTKNFASNITEETSMTSENNTSSEITSSDNLTGRVDNLESRVATIESRLTNPSQTNSSLPTSSMHQVSSMVASSSIPEPKTIPLNIEAKRGDVTVTFKSATLKYKENHVVFDYKTSKKISHAPERGIYSTLKGKSGAIYEELYFQGIDTNGSVAFQNITDFSDLSTVTLTYAFEGFDPVTVTFDIPGI